MYQTLMYIVVQTFFLLGALPYKRHHTDRYFGTGTRYSKGPVPDWPLGSC
jgi:hypothetical protein